MQRTLLIPLWGRAKELERPHPLIRDELARDLVAKLDFDFEAAFANMPPQFLVSCVARAWHIDAFLKNLIAAHPDATIINIGAGLDTTFSRVDNGRITWYDLDLPDAIALRRQLIPEGPRNFCLAKSVFDRSWFDDIRPRGSKLALFAAGVLVYLPKEEMRSLLRDLPEAFPGAEMLFETYSRLLSWLRNRVVKLPRHADHPGAPFLWAPGSGKSIARLSGKIELVGEFPLYSRFDVPADWDEKVRSQMKVIRALKLIRMVHLKFAG